MTGHGPVQKGPARVPVWTYVQTAINGMVFGRNFHRSHFARLSRLSVIPGPQKCVKQQHKASNNSPKGHCFTCFWGPGRGCLAPQDVRPLGGQGFWISTAASSVHKKPPSLHNESPYLQPEESNCEAVTLLVLTMCPRHPKFKFHRSRAPEILFIWKSLKITKASDS